MNKSNSSTIYIVFALITVFVAAGGFYAGTTYQKAQGTPAATASAGSGNLGGGANGGGGFGSRLGGGSIGAVTTVSDTSITITPRARGTTTATPKTYAINSATTVTNNSSTVAASTIAVGDNVLIQTSTSDTSTATSITVNPSFGGRGGGQAPTGSAQGTTDGNSGSAPQSST